MKILMIGGTLFLGRHIVQSALDQGHEVTLFNRGRRSRDLFPDAEKLYGDRDGDLEPLRGRRWDAVIDTCGYVPRVVRKSAELLAGAASHYTFISSISVYAGPLSPGAGENAPLETTEDETIEDVMAAYGALKALCERTVEDYFPGRALHLRPGLIVGPYDYIDRFPYWVHRIAQGGEVLAPGSPARRVQLIDARDIANWTIRMIEEGKTGPYNVTGPDYPLTMGDMLQTIKQATRSSASLTWVDESFLVEHGVGPFMEMPFWLPEEDNGLLEVSIEKALRDNLRFRPLAETVRDVHAWNQTREPAGGKPGPMQVGMRPERETALLEEWHALQRARS